jgi:hypothetical protein
MHRLIQEEHALWQLRSESLCERRRSTHNTHRGNIDRIPGQALHTSEVVEDRVARSILLEGVDS